MTISATPLPAAIPPAIEITLSSVTPGGNLLRDGKPVRGGAITAADQIVIDYDAPLGRTVIYTYGAESTPALVSSATSWLCHPSIPSISRPVTIRNDDPITFAARGTVLRPLSGGTPFAVYGPRSGRSGFLELVVRWADRGSLVSLLFSDGSPLLLRTPPACLIDDGWIWIADLEHTHAIDSDYVYLGLNYERVTPPATLPPAGSRPIEWNDTVDLYASWDAVTADLSSWDALVASTIPTTAVA